MALCGTRTDGIFSRQESLVHKLSAVRNGGSNSDGTSGAIACKDAAFPSVTYPRAPVLCTQHRCHFPFIRLKLASHDLSGTFPLDKARLVVHGDDYSMTRGLPLYSTVRNIHAHQRGLMLFVMITVCFGHIKRRHKSKSMLNCTGQNSNVR